MNNPTGHNKLYKVVNPLTRIPLNFKCIKGGKYKDSLKLGDLERKKLAFTARNECPYLLRLSNLKNGGFKFRSARSEEETFHNHPLDEANLLNTHKGRYSNLEVEEIRAISIEIDQNSKARDIQKSISIGNKYNKVTVHDVNNLKYFAKKPEAISKASEIEAIRLIEAMESKNFVLAYQFNAAKFLNGIYLPTKQ
ncbi:uncharacterized protein B0P05DRAFT_582677 [Gilbertella persicaria]|uniref:uncharacterized protein n=1 Tax=Gilbertella persicaria TaxID=101096 RepID=UPI00221FB1C8|nr:uncharacterized protein B0P05DRAFT_582677 [Gilbertella persicaria]KAI8098338.1 hypothetical protein B0P05DRAFT_582677 [Gilbertella persicaria]